MPSVATKKEKNMSYCRNNGKDSDVYVIATSRAPEMAGRYRTVWVCYCKNGYEADTRKQMVEHLLKHQANGDKVPQSAFDRFQEEIDAE